MPLPPRPIPLIPSRVHEVEGPSAPAFALIAAAQAGARVLWIRPGWEEVAPFPDGLAALLPPDRLMIAETAQEADTIAVAEEALKDGAVPLVVVGITRPLNLRESRRLQLAARAGGTTGLCLIPKGMGSNATETRWHCAPVFGPGADSTLMRWDLTKNKAGTIGSWHVLWNWQAHRLDVVSPAPFGPGPAAAPD